MGWRDFRGLLIAAATIGLGAAFLIFANQSAATRGSGSLAAEVREFGRPVESLTVDDELTVVVVVDPAQPQRLTLTVDDNLLPMIRTALVGGELRISTTEDVIISLGANIRLVVPDLKAIKADHESIVRVTNLVRDRFTIDVRSQSIVRVAGSAEEVIVRSHRGRVDLSQMLVQTATVDIEGSHPHPIPCWMFSCFREPVGADAVVDLNVARAVSGVADGRAEVRVFGSPATLDIATSDGAQVRRLRRPE